MSVVAAALLLSALPGEAAYRRGAWIGSLQLCTATVRRVVAATNRYSGEPTITVALTPAGARRLADLTARSIGKPLPIRIDGRVVSQPTVVEAVRGGMVEINGPLPPERHRLAAIVRQRCG